MPGNTPSNNPRSPQERIAEVKDQAKSARQILD
jgi:hypothetical protein